MSPLPNGPGPGALAERGDQVRGRRRKGAQRRRLARGQRDLAVRLGEAGQAVEHQEHVLALVAEHLGGGHRHPRSAPLDQRGLIGGRGDHHRARHALGAEHSLGEVAQLAAALADQAVDDDVGLDAAGEVGEQRRLADSGAREDADPLAARHRQHGVARPAARWPAAPRAPCAWLRRADRGAAAPRSDRASAGVRPAARRRRRRSVRPSLRPGAHRPGRAASRRRRPPPRRAAGRSSPGRRPRTARRSRRRASRRRAARSPPGRRSVPDASAPRSPARPGRSPPPSRPAGCWRYG